MKAKLASDPKMEKKGDQYRMHIHPNTFKI